ncbi:MAG: hypothetical protein SPF58_08510 [Candidatus Cryptobacteroides sp.]|uniref:hypothetical protein n=1 Tax=Candidatus Cryptobacteroides sp. TaxID=2952915 RepID=UPI002A91D5B9|nr:hypothetical protein [Candidatus Cryptobacteroides sp.]MDY5567303.1 hypothetical protein [Candidatus Cryptobacteroides sp.]
MSPRHLWAGPPCRRTVRRPPSPREDVSEALVGRVAVPKGRQMTASPRRHTPEASVGRVAVPKDGQKTPFATRGCL